MSIQAVDARVPEVFSIPSTSAHLDGLRIIENNGDEQFVFITLLLNVDWGDSNQLELPYSEVTLTTGDETLVPVGTFNLDGRVKDFRVPVRSKFRMRDFSGGRRPMPEEIRLCVIFHFNPEQSFNIALKGQSKEASARPVATLQQDYQPKITIVEASLVDRFEKAPTTSFSAVPGTAEVLDPPVGSVLALTINVDASKSNKDAGGGSYVFKPSDFYLSDGRQVIPFHTLLGRQNFMTGSLFSDGTLPSDDPELVLRAQLEGEPIKEGTDLTILFLVDPDTEQWELYFGHEKVAAIPRPDK
ncbi:hypothetical protein DDZ13_06365 [Coraliomargarita sinensis]|uniref:Uncharacterized protein n=1 Tax=Coraliomargarita sinensis TaxID=2174842 RepID=A0A317ZKT6_9BACT|nr:hypothetical protein DDZ13_06365 [Coraliomargarita sinensis]